MSAWGTALVMELLTFVVSSLVSSAWVAISAYEDAFAMVRVGRSPHVYGPNRGKISEKVAIECK